MDYNHQIVNHSKNVVNPDTGANIQTIEAVRSVLKTKIL